MTAETQKKHGPAPAHCQPATIAVQNWSSVFHSSSNIISMYLLGKLQWCCRLSGPFNVGIPRLMTRFTEIPSLVHSSATQQISFSIMAIITFTLLTFFYLHTPLLFTTLCIFQYLFCIQISKTQFKSLCIYFPGEDIYFTSGVQSIIIIYYIIYLWH